MIEILDTWLSVSPWIGVGLIVIGFVALVKGADCLVDGASALARRFGISDLVIGLTVVAFGTSMPEFVVNMVSVSEGSTDLAITNVLGSNIINTFVILGLTAVVYPVVSQRVSWISLWQRLPDCLFWRLHGLAVSDAGRRRCYCLCLSYTWL